jgi:hypothetical protein
MYRADAEKIAAGQPVNVDFSTHFRLPHFVRFTAPPFHLWGKEEVLGTAEKTRHGEDGRLVWRTHTPASPFCSILSCAFCIFDASQECMISKSGPSCQATTGHVTQSTNSHTKQTQLQGPTTLIQDRISRIEGQPARKFSFNKQRIRSRSEATTGP